jgi:hypothetical protein
MDGIKYFIVFQLSLCFVLQKERKILFIQPTPQNYSFWESYDSDFGDLLEILEYDCSAAIPISIKLPSPLWL